MKRKGQVVRLKSRETGAIIEAKVIQYDSIQGYWLKDVTTNDGEEYVPGEDLAEDHGKHVSTYPHVWEVQP